MTNQEFIESIRLEGEEWRDIPGWEGFYCASTFGRIASVGRFVSCKGGSHKWHNPKILQPNKSKRTGYLLVPLSARGRIKRFSVHRLTAITFIDNPDNKPCVDHIDGDKTNNCVSNLRWCTHHENMSNPFTKNYLRKFYENDTRAKHTRPVVALKDGKVIKLYPSTISVELDGHSRDNVYLACTGRRKTHHDISWMYLSDYENLISISKNSLPKPDND